MQQINHTLKQGRYKIALRIFEQMAIGSCFLEVVVGVGDVGKLSCNLVESKLKLSWNQVQNQQ
jgi:hypothetical protein